MAHFAEVDSNNIVLRVLVIDNEHEHRGQDFLSNDLGLGGRWIQTSYNAYKGKRWNPNTNELTNEPGFRKNFAGTGYIYMEDIDAFVEPKPFTSWLIDADTGTWIPPISYPEDSCQAGGKKVYSWDEENQAWINPRDWF
jgi:hypothetical protein